MNAAVLERREPPEGSANYWLWVQKWWIEVSESYPNSIPRTVYVTDIRSMARVYVESAPDPAVRQRRQGHVSWVLRKLGAGDICTIPHDRRWLFVIFMLAACGLPTSEEWMRCFRRNCEILGIEV